MGGRTVRVYPLFHPAAALRTPRVKEQLREDFARLPELLVESRQSTVDGLQKAVGSRQEEVAETVAPVEQLGFFG